MSARKTKAATEAAALMEQERSARSRKALAEAAAGEGGSEQKDGDERWWCTWCMEDFMVPRPVDPAQVTCPHCQHHIDDQFDPNDNDPGMWPMGRKAGFIKERNRLNMATAAAEKPKAEKKAKTANPCLCGCGTETFGKWAPGHDARYHGAERKVRDGRMSLAEFNKAFPKATIAQESPNIDKEANTEEPPKAKVKAEAEAPAPKVPAAKTTAKKAAAKVAAAAE